jgi:hypothetical protein
MMILPGFFGQLAKGYSVFTFSASVRYQPAAAAALDHLVRHRAQLRRAAIA